MDLASVWIFYIRKLGQFGAVSGSQVVRGRQGHAASSPVRRFGGVVLKRWFEGTIVLAVSPKFPFHGPIRKLVGQQHVAASNASQPFTGFFC